MIKNELENWLRSIFRLPVEYMKGQSIAEGVIYYTLVGAPIETRIVPGEGMSFHYQATILVRSPIDADYIGYLTSKLSNFSGRIDGFSIELNESSEIIEDVNPTHETMSKTISVTHKVNNDKIREQINAIDIHFKERE